MSHTTHFSDPRAFSAAWTMEPANLRPDMEAGLDYPPELGSAEEYGVKHANLVKLHKLIADLNLPGTEVPLPFGLASSHVSAFLEAKAPEVSRLWGELAELYQHAEAQDESFLKLPGVAEKLTQIETAITNAFDSINGADEFPGDYTQFQAWLAEIKKKGAHLMVRSTGAEDASNKGKKGKGATNAGGNLSEAYVNPRAAEVLSSAGRVVASYFSLSSLGNRLKAGENPFEGKLKMAVTIQELIGEEIGGAQQSAEIPISMVLFSNEPDYGGDEKFRILRISATHGHGEGVVGAAGVRSDTYIVLQSRTDPSDIYVVADIQTKDSRLAPVRDGDKVKLGKLANAPDLSTESALSPTLLKRLFQLAVAVEKKGFDSQPTDMEIVVKAGKIYPIQARPVNRQESTPTYVDPDKIEKHGVRIEKSLDTKVLVTGPKSAMAITDPAEILVAPTLEEAEQLFDTKLHRCVVVAEDEPALSHPVVNFSSMAIPCFYAKEEFSMAKGDCLLVDSQTGTLRFMEAKTGLKPSELFSEGYVAHPAPVAPSIEGLGIVRSLPSDKPLPAEIKHALTDLKMAHAGKRELERLHQAVQSELNHYRGRIRELPQQPEVAEFASAVSKLATALDHSFAEAHRTLEDPSSSRLERLFHIKVLESYITQPLSRDGSVGKLSVMGLADIEKATDAMLTYRARREGKPARFVEEVLDGELGLTPQVSQNWTRSLLEFEALIDQGSVREETGQQLQEALRSLRSVGGLSTWMTLVFDPMSKQQKSSQALLEELLAGVNEETAKFITRITATKSEIDNLRRNLGEFAQTNRLAAMQEQLYALREKLDLEGYQKTTPFGKLIGLQVINDYVALFDSAIKTMKASRKHESDAVKAQRFKEMLLEYMSLLDEIAGQLVNENDFEFGAEEVRDRMTLAKCLNRIRGLLSANPATPDQMKPSPRFNVQGAVLGSKARFDRHQPQTLEDIFTLIHQNLLACVAKATLTQLPEATFESLSLPKPMLLGQKTGFLSHESHFRSSRIGVETTENALTVKFNIPVRNHSSTYQFVYDKKSGKTLLHIQLIGEARDRWIEMKHAMRALHGMDKIKLLKEPKVSDLELDLSLEVRSEAELEFIMEHYLEALSASLDRDKGRLFRRLIQGNTKQVADIDPLIRETLSLIEKTGPSSDTCRTLLEDCIKNHKLTAEQARLILMAQIPADAKAPMLAALLDTCPLEMTGSLLDALQEVLGHSESEDAKTLLHANIGRILGRAPQIGMQLAQQHLPELFSDSIWEKARPNQAVRTVYADLRALFPESEFSMSCSSEGDVVISGTEKQGFLQANIRYDSKTNQISLELHMLDDQEHADILAETIQALEGLGCIRTVRAESGRLAILVESSKEQRFVRNWLSKLRPGADKFEEFLEHTAKLVRSEADVQYAYKHLGESSLFFSLTEELLDQKISAGEDLKKIGSDLVDLLSSRSVLVRPLESKLEDIIQDHEVSSELIAKILKMLLLSPLPYESQKMLKERHWMIKDLWSVRSRSSSLLWAESKNSLMNGRSFYPHQFDLVFRILYSAQGDKDPRFNQWLNQILDNIGNFPDNEFSKEARDLLIRMLNNEIAFSADAMRRLAQSPLVQRYWEEDLEFYFEEYMEDNI